MDIGRIEGVVTTVISVVTVLGAALRLYLQPMITKALDKQSAHFEKLFTDHMRYDHGYRGGSRSNPKDRYRPTFKTDTPPEEVL